MKGSSWFRAIWKGQIYATEDNVIQGLYNLWKLMICSMMQTHYWCIHGVKTTTLHPMVIRNISSQHVSSFLSYNYIYLRIAERIWDDKQHIFPTCQNLCNFPSFNILQCYVQFMSAVSVFLFFKTKARHLFCNTCKAFWSYLILLLNS